MRREFDINEWELVFHAPLTEDTTELVSGRTGIMNLSSGGTFDANKGLYGVVNAANKYFVQYDTRGTKVQDAFYRCNAFLLQCTLNIQSVRATGCRPYVFRTDNAAHTSNSIMYGYVSQNEQGLVFNTEQTFYQMSELDYDRMQGTTTRWNNLNSVEQHAVWANNTSGWRMNDFDKINYITILSSIQNNTCPTTGYVKDVKMWVKKTNGGGA